MICIPISAASNPEMLALIRRAAAEPADCYELRLDSLAEAPAVEELIAAADRPVVATCRSREEGGGFGGDATARVDILRRAVRAGAGYIDCEAGDVAELTGAGGARIIVSMHDFAATPADLDDRVGALAATGADWVKFAVAATLPSDILRVADALARCPKPAIGIAMGETGLAGRVLAGRFGSRLTFASLEAGRESAPGQITARELAGLYRYHDIDARTRLFAVLAPPGKARPEVEAANRAFAAAGENAVCLPFAAADSHAAEDFLAALPRGLDLCAILVAEPYRALALDWAAESTPAARERGGAAHLWRGADGRWLADHDPAAGADGLLRRGVCL